MVLQPVPQQQQPIPWQQSTGMVGSYVSQLLGLLAAAAAVLLGFSEELPRWLVILCAVVVGVAGGGGAYVGVRNARRRRAKGASPACAEPPIAGPAAGAGAGFARVALLAVVAAAGLLVFLVQCSGPPLTAPQAQAGAHTLGLSCDIVRELVNPDVLPVSPEEAALADRICAGAEVVGGVVFAGLSRPLLGAPRVGAPAEEDQSPRVPAWTLASRCARPGLSPGARDACAVLMAAAQEGHDITVVAQASAGAAP